MLAAGSAVFLLSLVRIANFFTDYLWFDAIGFGRVWRTVLFSRIVLGVVFIAIFALLCSTNLWLADRLAPAYREPSPEEEAVARFRELVGERWGWIRLGITGLFALTIGAPASAQWRNWLLFTNTQDFGIDDPQFGRDIGFFVFRMPFLQWLTGWLFTSLFVILVLTIAVHYLAGGIRIQSVNERVTPQVKAHVSLLLAAMALVRAASYWLDRYALAYSTDGRFAGLSYTDVEARLPVLSLLILIALLSVVLFLVNIRRRGWGLPAVAVGLWALVSIVMGGIYPLVVQRLRVEPVETTREAPYVERHLEATKQAYNIGDIELRRFAYDEALVAADVQGNADNLAAVPLLDPEVTAQTFELEQVERSFFRFDETKVDVDRYVIGGEVTPVVIGARELNPQGIPESGWESEVLSFTHGNGIALAPANTIAESLPIFLIGDVPIDNEIEGDIAVEQPRIYYGENMNGYAIVDTDRDEVDSIEAGSRVPYNYTGVGGVDAGGLWRRAMFALRFSSIDPLISDFVRDDSRFVWNRNVLDRAQKVAPFLEFDHNPYPAVVDGRIKWVIDAYTTTSNYPYSQPRNPVGLNRTSELTRGFNYVRNSVKAVVDAYDGTVDLYVVDENDPLIKAWDSAFPGVLSDFDEMPEGLIDNLRYPEDIFTVQTNMWATYHIDIDETADFLEGSDEWAVAQDPGGVEGADSTTTIDAQGVASSSEVRVRPYYSLLRLPEENQQEFVVVRTFVPFSANDEVKEMQAFMAGVSEPGDDHYGRLVSYEIDNVSGDIEAQAPSLVASQITSQEEISERISLLNAPGEGSSVRFGDLIVVPVENTFVYVRPMYVIATGTQQPNLEWIIVSYADRVVMCHGLEEAIIQLFGTPVRGAQSSGTLGECIGDINDGISAAASGGSDDSTTSNGGDGSNLVIGDGTAVEEAVALLDQADEALLAGDLGRYQDLVDRAAGILGEALAAADAADSETGDG